MGRVVIREYKTVKRQPAAGSGGDTGLIQGELITDRFGLPIKAVETVVETNIDSPRLTASTHFVQMESDANVRYAIRPKKLNANVLLATRDHPLIPAGSVVVEAVYPGCIINFYQTSPVGIASGPAQPFQSTYIPVLAF